MIHKDDILNVLIKECRICIRVFSKLPPEAYDYRPTPGQRSTFELLQYMTYAFAGAAHAIVGNGWDWWKEHEAVAKDMTPDAFPAAMNTQIESLQTLFASLSDDVLENRKVTEVPWPTENTVGVELLDNCLRWLIGYKMQLFLYARSNGVEMSTMDCWFTTEDA